jgi:hypothetical protein
MQSVLWQVLIQHTAYSVVRKTECYWGVKHTFVCTRITTPLFRGSLTSGIWTSSGQQATTSAPLWRRCVPPKHLQPSNRIYRVKAQRTRVCFKMRCGRRTQQWVAQFRFQESTVDGSKYEKKNVPFRCNEDIFLKPNVLIALRSVAVKLLFQCIKLHFSQGMHKSRESGFNCDKFCRAAPNILGVFLCGTCFNSTFGWLKFARGFYISLQNLYTPVLALTFICSVV